MRLWARLIVLSVSMGADAATARAWTRAQDEIFFARSVRYFTTEFTGKRGASFRRASTEIYAKYGLKNAITLGGQVVAGHRSDGLSEGVARGFLRGRLWTGEASDVVSAEIGGGYAIAAILLFLACRRRQKAGGCPTPLWAGL